MRLVEVKYAITLLSDATSHPAGNKRSINTP